MALSQRAKDFLLSALGAPEVRDEFITAINTGSNSLSNILPGTNITLSLVNGQLTINASGGGGGSGTVTSVNLALPSIFTVSGNPVTTSGTLTGTFNTQTANTIFSGPASGGAATPTFRVLAVADMKPAGSTTQIQFNDGGVLGSDADFTWDKTANVLTVNGNITGASNTTLTIHGGNGASGSQTGGQLVLQSGAPASGNGAGAILTLKTPNPSGTGRSGAINVFTGDTSSNTTGDIFLGTGTTDNAHVSGSLILNTGGGTNGSTGQVQLITGSLNTGGTGITGDIYLEIGHEDSAPSGETRGTVRIEGHLTSQQVLVNRPAIAAQSGAGTGATATLSATATDTVGNLELVLGSAAFSTGAQVKITFTHPYVGAPTILLTPKNSTAGANLGAYYVTSTTTDFTVNFTVAALGTDTYDWYYFVMDTA